jgi:hypothetical protein
MCPALTLQQVYKLTEHHHDDWITTGSQTTDTLVLLQTLKRIVDATVRPRPRPWITLTLNCPAGARARDCVQGPVGPVPARTGLAGKPTARPAGPAAARGARAGGAPGRALATPPTASCHPAVPFCPVGTPGARPDAGRARRGAEPVAARVAGGARGGR